MQTEPYYQRAFTKYECVESLTTRYLWSVSLNKCFSTIHLHLLCYMAIYDYNFIAPLTYVMIIARKLLRTLLECDGVLEETGDTNSLPLILSICTQYPELYEELLALVIDKITKTSSATVECIATELSSLLLVCSYCSYRKSCNFV